MRKSVFVPICLAVATGLAFSGAGLAYGVDAPPAKTSHAGVKYVIGGVGADERRAMRSAYPHYKLRVEVARKSGAYSADMRLRIATPQGHELLNVFIDGPWLLVDLDRGDYLLMVRKDGQEFTQKITLGGEAQQQVVFMWPESDPDPS